MFKTMNEYRAEAGASLAVNEVIAWFANRRASQALWRRRTKICPRCKAADVIRERGYASCLSCGWAQDSNEEGKGR